ncbi:hypothetical protein OAB57_03905, partial [Bacteriovoracaceae bacterium]|nr:hypothetical protein [Bacteriovoracaceae bacterium]
MKNRLHISLFCILYSINFSYANYEINIATEFAERYLRNNKKTHIKNLQHFPSCNNNESLTSHCNLQCRNNVLVSTNISIHDQQFKNGRLHLVANIVNIDTSHSFPLETETVFISKVGQFKFQGILEHDKETDNIIG